MIYNKELSVKFQLLHILDIKNVHKKITTNFIIKKIITLNKFYKKIFKKNLKLES